MLDQISRSAVSADSEQEICEELADAVARAVNVPSVSVMMIDELAKSLKVVGYRGLAAGYVENLQIRSGERYVVARHGIRGGCVFPVGIDRLVKNLLLRKYHDPYLLIDGNLVQVL